MLPPDERNRLAEPATMLVDQLRPMFILLGRHRIEDLRGGGEVVAQALGVPAIDPSVVFFGRDRQRKHLLLRKVLELPLLRDSRDHPISQVVRTSESKGVREDRTSVV